jgi:hypothetical protein
VGSWQRVSLQYSLGSAQLRSKGGLWQKVKGLRGLCQMRLQAAMVTAAAALGRGAGAAGVGGGSSSSEAEHWLMVLAHKIVQVGRCECGRDRFQCRVASVRGPCSTFLCCYCLGCCCGGGCGRSTHPARVRLYFKLTAPAVVAVAGRIRAGRSHQPPCAAARVCDSQQGSVPTRGKGLAPGCCTHVACGGESAQGQLGSQGRGGDCYCCTWSGWVSQPCGLGRGGGGGGVGCWQQQSGLAC